MTTELQALIDTSDMFDSQAFDMALAKAGKLPIPAFKAALQDTRAQMDQMFREGVDIRRLIYGRAAVLDYLLQAAWQRFDWPCQSQISLIAVGGYGRGELHPHSDIDLLILLDESLDAEVLQPSISGFLTLLWDINLDVGSSVRTLQECYDHSLADITIATNLIESRCITGSKQLQQQMYDKVVSEQAWSAEQFLLAKLEEQQQRHQRTNNTEYNLEPNLKNSQGGLRDIQTIGWVAKRHFGTSYIHGLVEHGFVTESELDALNRGELYLWSVRYALHMINRKREDRLLFDHQRTLAELFGYQDQEGKLAVEQFMAKYYRVAMQMSGFNDMLLQHFDEVIIKCKQPQTIVPLNNRFQIHNNFLEVTCDDVFKKTPFALMELFVLLAQNREIQGVRASTARLIRDHWYLIDDDFRSDIRNTSLFMELLRQRDGVSTELKRMIRYGILGLYLPEFGRIIGQMQHDLFHIYTVDAHTVKVIRKCRQFRHSNHQEQFPVAHRLVNQLPKIELLYIAALYHDIAKGRGGDHSELGAIDVVEFCERHQLGKWDTQLIAWLVKSHLLMSMTAQRKDISDPEVIYTFAKQVQDITHLDYLYVLTVADINATNNTLWNNWRATLMRKLYVDTKLALQRGLETPVNRQDLIDQVQQEALSMLGRRHVDTASVTELWSNIGEDYFLQETATNVAWHTEALLEHGESEQPLVMLWKTSYRLFEGATEIFIYTRDVPNLFPAVVATLDQLGLSVQDARVILTDVGTTLHTYTVLSEDDQPLSENPSYHRRIRDRISAQIGNPADFPDVIHRRVPRQMKLFATPTAVALSNEASSQHTLLEVTAPDRPGLLARIGRVFAQYDIKVSKAKITSIGERVEDFFFISNELGEPITDPQLCEMLQQQICRQLDEHITSGR